MIWPASLCLLFVYKSLSRSKNTYSFLLSHQQAHLPSHKTVQYLTYTTTSPQPLSTTSTDTRQNACNRSRLSPPPRRRTRLQRNRRRSHRRVPPPTPWSTRLNPQETHLHHRRSRHLHPLLPPLPPSIPRLIRQMASRPCPLRPLDRRLRSLG
jgi:hypothetical protein